MRFTVEEFDKMVYELMQEETPCCETLWTIVERELGVKVICWCRDDSRLRGRGFERDIMHDIFLHLVKTTVPSFLLKKQVNGPYNNDPEGFSAWIKTVGQNVLRNFAARVGRDDRPPEPEPKPEPDDETKEKLNEALRIVLDADAGVYKVLTWLAQSVFMLKYDVTKIKSNDLILAAFQEKTLYEMYDMLLGASKQIKWLVIKPEQKERILTALQEKRADGRTYGDTEYREFFMKYKGEISGKKSVSDWVNRLNDKIRRLMPQAVSKRKRGGKRSSGGQKAETKTKKATKTKKGTKKKGKGKRSDGDGTSDN